MVANGTKMVAKLADNLVIKYDANLALLTQLGQDFTKFALNRHYSSNDKDETLASRPDSKWLLHDDDRT
ncbi:hypothetical protein TNCV_1623341 [Trichonephila clavipes]|nr:hypothetical protein TNCV_1623341 [Trichonephila clavipes]